MKIDRERMRRYFFNIAAPIIIVGYVFYVVTSFFSNLEFCSIPDDAIRIEDSVYHFSQGKVYSEGVGVQDVDGAFGCSTPFTLVQNANPESFTVINRNYGKDGDDVFFYEKEIALDPKTATTVKSELNPGDSLSEQTQIYRSSEFVKDTHSVFYRLKKVEGINADKSTIVSLDDVFFLRDEENIFYRDKLLAGANPRNLSMKSYRPYGYQSLIVDEDQVWIIDLYGAREVEGADPATITFIKDERYLRDLQSVFFYRKKIDVDPDTFEVLSHGFVRDRNGVYCHEMQIDGTYRVIKIPGADSTTFTVLNRTYAKDRQNSYYSNCTFSPMYSVVIEGADAQTFEALSESEAQDKKYVYKEGNQYRRRFTIGE